MSNILICDDDITTREMLGGVLKTNGFTVTTVSDGQSALKAFKKKKFDLVLLDIWMPGMTGLELLGQLQKEKEIPKIVVMTSDQTPETLLGALRGKVYQFIAKPIEADALLELVRLQAIQVRQDHVFGEVLVRKHSHFEEVMTEQAAVRDDWK